jgi:hypothetical protein
MTATFIFNQYYIDFLKRIKDVAKKNKQDSTTAKAVYKAIKEHYITLDKASDEYLIYFKEQITDDVWSKYIEGDCEAWVDEQKDVKVYKDISLGDVQKLMDDIYLCNHFMSVFYIFSKDLTDEVSAKIVNILQTIDSKALIDVLEDENIKKVLTKLHDLRNEKIKQKSGIDMNFIEDTTLGKLAKEILEDIDVGKLQKSMGENGDVLKAIGDPDSGFADIITNVSKKMATKISNGELKQENLIQDAMKFASIMPNIFGGGAAGSSPMGGMGGKGGKGPDLSNIMSMMSSMMSGGGDDDTDFASILKGMNKATKGNTPRGSRMSVNESALKKIAKAKKLKKKLNEKRKQQEAATSDTQPNTTTSE